MKTDSVLIIDELSMLSLIGSRHHECTILGMMHPTFHITSEMMKAVLERAFSAPATQSGKDAAKHLRDALVGTHGAYASVIFDILEMTAGRDGKVLAEMAFLIGVQVGYELGIAHPTPTAP